MNNCENCKYSEQMCGRLACMGQKYAPYVRPTDTCDSWKPKKGTEYDRIHAMSIEELAKWIYEAEGDPACVIREENEWLDWLKQEVSS